MTGLCLITPTPRQVTNLLLERLLPLDSPIRLYGQRWSCKPEHQAQTLKLCLADRKVLPRSQPDDGPLRGYNPQDKSGMYKGIKCWWSRSHWLKVTVPVALKVSTAILAKHHVSEALMSTWSKVMAARAHFHTGRNCLITPEALASVMGCSKRQAQRCNTAGREIGLAVVVRPGRMLNWNERAKAQRTGSTQRGLATIVALTIPSAVDHVTRSTGPKLILKSKINSIFLPSRKAARTKETATRSPRKGSVLRKKARVLASELAVELPWLASDGPRRYVPMLMRFVTCKTPWTGTELATAIHNRNMRLFLDEPVTIHTRASAVLAKILRDIHEINDHPGKHCTHPECDGHGWCTAQWNSGRTTWSGQPLIYTSLTKCPECNKERMQE